MHETYADYKGGRVLLGIAVDITEMAEAQEVLRHTEKLKSLGVLAGGVAHDFNNLLVGVHAGLALARIDEESELRTYLQGIETAAIRAAELCRQLLAYAGKGKFVVTPLDVSAVVKEMLDLVHVSIHKTIVVETMLAQDLPPVLADLTQVRQIVLNLVTNAAEAIGTDPGTIRITTGSIDADRAYLDHLRAGSNLPQGTYTYIEVADTGCGMDKEVERRIFDPFFSTKLAGRGLGLAAVHGIVTGHKGGLMVHSAPEEGSVFRFLLPAGRESIPKRHDREPGGEAGYVLVVDDEPQVRTVVRAMLNDLGYQVLDAADGETAMEIARAEGNRISAVVLDRMIPESDCAQTMQGLRDAVPGLPVILSSGFADSETDAALADAFLRKPFSRADLLEILQSVLGPS